MTDEKKLDLNVDVSSFTDDDYHEIWSQMRGIRIRMVEKTGKCKHKLGETYYYDNPITKPEGLCNDLLHVLDLYTWRTVVFFPSWDPKDRKSLMIHCPSKKGTVWEMKKAL